MIEINGSHRRIKLNHSNALPRYIIALDTETTRTALDEKGLSFSHKLRIGVAITVRLRGTQAKDRKVYKFSNAEDFWQLLLKYTKPNYTTWIVAHNALFDFIVADLPKRFENGQMTLDAPRSKRKREDNNEDNAHVAGLCVIDSPPTIISARVSASQGRLVIVDTLNWHPQPLSELGNAVKLLKLAMPKWDENDETWMEYCERDCEIVLRTFLGMIQFVRENNLGMFRYTAPSQAIAAYRHRFMPRQIFPHDNTVIKQIERAGYFGGRLECFRLGRIRGESVQLDVASLFPSIMANCTLPYVLHRSDRSERWRCILPDIDWQNAVAEVTLSTEKPLYPKRGERNVIYPVGVFRTVLTGPELNLAKQNGDIVAIKSWAEYKTAILFADYVNEFWAMRQRYKAEQNYLYESFCKRLLNSLYGKFAQRSHTWLNEPRNMSALPWSRWVHINTLNGEHTHYRSFGWQVQRQIDRAEVDGTFVAISSFITSAARLRMNELRKLAGVQNVHYQAVDSLIVSESGYDRLCMAGEVAENELGKLRVQVASDKCWVQGCNDYIIGDKIICSGKPKQADYAERVIVEQRRFMTGQLLFNGTSSSEVIETERQWARISAYTKGVLGANGEISPLRLDETNDTSPMSSMPTDCEPTAIALV